MTFPASRLFRRAVPGEPRLRRAVPAALVATALLALAGCVYLRLLQVKNQLLDFDNNFALIGRPELTIEFRRPVLYAKDARFLIGADPLNRTDAGREKVWAYEFDMARREAVPAAPLEKLSLKLHMRDGRLAKIVVPETFMLIFPRNVIIETLRQAPHAEILQMKRTAHGRVRLTEHSDAELPSRAKTTSLLGPPLETVPEEGRETLVYRYRISGARRDVPIIARFTFSPDELLRRVIILWDTSTVDVEYLRD